jgi:uncharacterized membrane protein
MSWVGQIISVIAGLLALWRYWVNYQENKAKKEADERDVNRDKALDDLKKAETDEEIDNALDDIIDNSP